MPSSEYKVNILISTKDQTARGSKQATQGLDLLAKAAAAAAVGYGALRVAQKGLEFVKMGAQVQMAERRFHAFAGGAANASRFLDTFNQATDNTVDKMSAMRASARLLQMGLVTNNDEMEIMASVAVKLGDQTREAGDRINDFTLLLANQSVRRLDNFGISSGKVRQRIDELLASGQALTREEAFKIATLEEGRKALDTLGDTSDTLSTKMGQLQAVTKTARQELGLMAAEDADDLIRAFGGTGGLVEIIDQFPGKFRAYRQEMQDTRQLHRWTNDEIIRMREGLTDGAQRWDQYSDAIAETNIIMDESIPFTNELSDATLDYLDSLGESEEVGRDYISTSRDIAEVNREIEATLRDTGRALQDVQADWSGLLRDQADDAADFDKKLEQAAEKHQENLTKINRKGQAYRVRIDELAESDKLENLQERLTIALQQQNEFTDKTKESTRMNKDRQIRLLNEQLGEQTRLLDDHANDRLWKAGQNVNGLLAEEQRRYDEEMRMLGESRAEQEEEQRRSLGRMLLQHFETWAEMNGVTGQAFLNMRLNIMEEYGLITEEGRQAAEEQSRMWAAEFAIMRGEAENFFDYFLQQLDALPTEKVIRIRTELSTPDLGGSGGGLIRQHGGPASGMTLVGDGGPELVRLPPGSHVFSNSQSSNITNNWNMTVNTRATSGTVRQDMHMLRALVGAA